MSKVVDFKKWSQSVPQPSMEEVLKKKKVKREKRIKQTKRQINQIRNKE